MPTCAVIMSRSASLLNDTAQSMFTNVAQLPYLKTAWDELRELCQLNNVPVTNDTITTLIIPVGINGIGGGGSQPALPTDLIEIQGLYERTNGSGEIYSLMNKVDFLPSVTVATSALIYWTWQEQVIKFLPVGATSIRQIRLDYITTGGIEIVDSTTIISTINAMSFLSYRTAALCAQFIGENSSRSEALNAMAVIAMDRFLGINTKGRQSIATRRRPFRAGYKSRNSM